MRENYCITLNLTAGGTVTIFFKYIQAFVPEKDGTCLIVLEGGLTYHVNESEETIVNRGKMHNVIVKVG